MSLLIKGGFLLSFIFSLGVMPAKVCAIETVEDLQSGFEEASSPEDGSKAPSLNPTTNPTTVSFAGTESSGSLLEPSDNKIQKRTVNGIQGMAPVGVPGPIFVDGIYNVKANPIGAVIAAGLTLTFMTLKETGKVDLDSLLFLLNSTDFYAGLAGTAAGATGQWGGVQIASKLKAAAARKSPGMLAPLVGKEAFQTFSNIVNGFTYTLAVTSGYEVFSQFWKIATKHIPEARKVTDFVNCSWEIKKLVAMKLLYYTIQDTNLQKKVMDSIMYHRVMTFDFLAMNVGLYVGAQLGTYLASKALPGNKWAKSIGPVVGSAAGGLLVELMPKSWKDFFNSGFISAKIWRKKSVLDGYKAMLQEAVSRGMYPDHSNEGTGSYWMSGVDLGEDIERIFSARETLTGLYMQQAAIRGDAMAWQDVGDLYSDLETFFSYQINQLAKPDPTLSELIETWVREKRSAREIRELTVHRKGASDKEIYYYLMLDEARERAKELVDELAALKSFMESAPDLPMPSGIGPN